MALITLDPTTALVIVDLQEGIVGLPFMRPIDTVVEHSRALLDALRRRGLPVVLVNVAGGAPGRTQAPHRSGTFAVDWTELIPERHQHRCDEADLGSSSAWAR